MEEKDPEELSWTLRFILICVSFFVFGWFVKLIGGSPAHVTVFTTIAYISMGLAVIFFIAGIVSAYLAKENNPVTPTE